MRPVVVALGNFDGVHLGHRAVLDRAAEEARRRGGKVVAATFWPHPRSVLGRGDAPGLLTDLGQRREELLRSGADEVRVIPFDAELSKKSPREFVEDVLWRKLGAAVVVVGGNFRFGYRASGDVGDLERLMREGGGEAYAVEVRGVPRASARRGYGRWWRGGTWRGLRACSAGPTRCAARSSSGTVGAGP